MLERQQLLSCENGAGETDQNFADSLRIDVCMSKFEQQVVIALAVLLMWLVYPQ